MYSMMSRSSVSMSQSQRLLLNDEKGRTLEGDITQIGSSIRTLQETNISNKTLGDEDGGEEKL